MNLIYTTIRVLNVNRISINLIDENIIMVVIHYVVINIKVGDNFKVKPNITEDFKNHISKSNSNHVVVTYVNEKVFTDVLKDKLLMVIKVVFVKKDDNVVINSKDLKLKDVFIVEIMIEKILIKEIQHIVVDDKINLEVSIKMVNFILLVAEQKILVKINIKI